MKPISCSLASFSLMGPARILIRFSLLACILARTSHHSYTPNLAGSIGTYPGSFVTSYPPPFRARRVPQGEPGVGRGAGLTPGKNVNSGPFPYFPGVFPGLPIPFPVLCLMPSKPGHITLNFHPILLERIRKYAEAHGMKVNAVLRKAFMLLEAQPERKVELDDY